MKLDVYSCMRMNLITIYESYTYNQKEICVRFQIDDFQDGRCWHMSRQKHILFCNHTAVGDFRKHTGGWFYSVWVWVVQMREPLSRGNLQGHDVSIDSHFQNFISPFEATPKQGKYRFMGVLALFICCYQDWKSVYALHRCKFISVNLCCLSVSVWLV